MGSQQSSYLSEIKIDEKCVVLSDFWSHHHAKITGTENSAKVSVLVGDLFVEDHLWAICTPLEKYSKNLMIYRHPCIVRYISSWRKSSKFHLAIEECVPLSHLLNINALSPPQIFVGIHSILKALCFLHDRARVSHNNVCTASIYVTRKDGSWKLGGMEFLCTYKEMTTEYLKKSRLNRYKKAVDPNEDSFQLNGRGDLADIYGFVNLVNELLTGKIDDTPNLSDFYNLCRTEIKNVNLAERPTFNSLLEHDFFKNDFIAIHSFLIELPLKSDQEKSEFFRNLSDRLREFPEVTVAKQLASLLLSRIVLLDKTAQVEVLPFVLCPRKEFDSCTKKIFSESVFKDYMVPKILEIFPVRDTQIRLMLLNYLPYFINDISKERLRDFVLPELLVGIKDTNDQLVSATLKVLGDLVPVLGASTVIGGNRAKLFNDGRPNALITATANQRHNLNNNSTNNSANVKINSVANANPSFGGGADRPSSCNDDFVRAQQRTEAVAAGAEPQNQQLSLRPIIIQDKSSSGDNVPTGNSPIQVNSLPERSRPDGGEADHEITLLNGVEEVTAEQLSSTEMEDDLENWDNWDTTSTTMDQNRNSSLTSAVGECIFTTLYEQRGVDNKDAILTVAVANSNVINEQQQKTTTKNNNGESLMIVQRKTSKESGALLPDILDLDIKKKRSSPQQGEDIDFFQDMEPVIKPTSKYLIRRQSVEEIDARKNINNSAGDSLNNESSVLLMHNMDLIKANENIEDDDGLQGDGWADEEW